MDSAAQAVELGVIMILALCLLGIWFMAIACNDCCNGASESDVESQQPPVMHGPLPSLPLPNIVTKIDVLSPAPQWHYPPKTYPVEGRSYKGMAYSSTQYAD